MTLLRWRPNMSSEPTDFPVSVHSEPGTRQRIFRGAISLGHYISRTLARSQLVRILLALFLAECTLFLALSSYFLDSNWQPRLGPLTVDIGLGTLAAVCFVITIRSLFHTNAAELIPSPSPLERITLTISRLRRRSIGLRWMAAFSLILIIGALVAGLSLFYLAADIADPSAFKKLDDILESRAITERRLAKISFGTTRNADMNVARSAEARVYPSLSPADYVAFQRVVAELTLSDHSVRD